MFSLMKKMLVFAATISFICGVFVPFAHAAETKMGYVDLRRAFYEYDKQKKLEEEFKTMSDAGDAKRNKKVEELTKIKDEMELLSADAKAKKQAEGEKLLNELQEFDRTIRQDLMTRKNDMFREVLEDIQKVSEDLGKKGNYDYIVDDRSLLYTNEALALTDQVVAQLNANYKAAQAPVKKEEPNNTEGKKETPKK